jgi:ferredoxin
MHRAPSKPGNVVMMTANRDSLKEKLKRTCMRKGAVVFGVASVEDVEALPRIRMAPAVRSLMGTKLLYTKGPAAAMPDARSVVVFGIPSTDDWCELGVRGERGEFQWPGYFPLSWIRRDVAQFLREEGYEAVFPYETSAPNSYKRVLSLAGIGSFGKNSLIISPKYGPWLRFSYLLTDAPLEPDEPFEEDLCGDCDLCVEACPVDALKPYVVDADRCLVNVHMRPRVPKAMRTALDEYEPQLTPATHVMCTRCQIVCPYTSARRRKNVISRCRKN